MREILFRGKRIDNGEWVEGWYQPEVEWGDHRFGVALSCKTTHGWLDDFEVIPETVGQYTGLTDKNGTKIFEGDVVRHHNGHPYAAVEKGKVYFDELYCGWRRTSNGAFHHGVVVTYKMSPECVYEVIGNIHDNPELLDGKGDGNG